jgi:hypothetical protein
MSEEITEVKGGHVVHFLWPRPGGDSRERVARPAKLIIETKSAPACDIDRNAEERDCSHV